MPGRDAENHADCPVDATTSPEGGEPGRELDILAEKPEPFEVVEAEYVETEHVDEAPDRHSGPDGHGVSDEPPANGPVPDGYTQDGIPTLSYARQRIAASLAEQEVFGQSAPAAGEEARQAALRHAASEKLKNLRKSLGQRDTPDEG